MNDTADIPAEEKSKGGIRRILLPLGLVVIMTGGGFASTFLGFWSPMAFFAAKEEHPPEAQAPTVEFVDIPQIVLTLAGPRSRMLIMTVKIETDQTHRAEVEHLVPRILDSFNSFLSNVDPSAFEKRGMLDIIRDIGST